MSILKVPINIQYELNPKCEMSLVAGEKAAPRKGTIAYNKSMEESYLY